MDNKLFWLLNIFLLLFSLVGLVKNITLFLKYLNKFYYIVFFKIITSLKQEIIEFKEIIQLLEEDEEETIP